MKKILNLRYLLKNPVVPDQKNEESNESGVLPEGASAAASTNVGTM